MLPTLARSRCSLELLVAPAIGTVNSRQLPTTLTAGCPCKGRPWPRASGRSYSACAARVAPAATASATLAAAAGRCRQRLLQHLAPVGGKSAGRRRSAAHIALCGRAPEGAGDSGGGGHTAEQRIEELLRLPDEDFRPEDVGGSWESYFAMRGFMPRNPEACTGALSVPLTILAAMDLFGLRFQPGEEVRIDLPGSRVLELANMDLVYEELGRAFYDNDVLLRLVGPELGRGMTPREGAMDLGNVYVTFHPALYQDLLREDAEAGEPPPHLAVAFHAGVQMHSSWFPALEALVSRGVPTAITGYSLSDIAAGLHEFRQSCDPRPRIVFEGVNHFACSERLLVDGVRETLSLFEDPPTAEAAAASEPGRLPVLQTALRDAQDVARAGGLEQLGS